MKIIIVGAGIAGLSAGVFARQSGFDVTIYEAHNIAGGNATGWKRKGYFFEGGMHWLVGSSEKTPLNKLWHEVGALQDNNPIYNRDPFLTYVHDDENISLYRDTEKLKQHLITISPQDEKSINRLVKDIQSLKETPMPITDIKGVMVKNKTNISMLQLFGYLKASRAMAKLSKITINDYISQFKHEGIRNLLSSVISLNEYSAMALLFTLGGLTANDSGYPKGGSIQMAQNMANTFQKLGGVIEYNKKVERIHMVDSKASGVWIDGALHEADAVIVTSDTLMAIDHLFVMPLHEQWMDQLRHKIKPVNCTFISLGINLDLAYLPENMVLPFKNPLIYDGKVYKSIILNNYATFEGYAPKGCTSVTATLFEDTYDEWNSAYAEGTYQDKKAELTKLVIHHFEQELPILKDKIDVCDIATPLTYEHFCGTYRGSWMSVMAPNEKNQIYPCYCESVSNLYFAGQRLMVPGGMPSAMMTARTAIQHLCKDTHTVFQGEI